MDDSATTLTKHQEAPEWLHEWLNIPFYEGTPKCSRHSNKYLTVFCGSCRETLFCQVCWKTDSVGHRGHPTVQVCIASHRAAVEKNAVTGVVGTSDIQEYVINHKKIVYLKPNYKAPSLDHHHLCHKCHTCQRKLRDANYSFCSISCKVGISATSGQCSQIAPMEEHTKIMRKKLQTQSHSQMEENTDMTMRNEGRKRHRISQPKPESGQSHRESWENTRIMGRKKTPKGKLQTESESQKIDENTDVMRDVEGRKRRRRTQLQLGTARTSVETAEVREVTYSELESPTEAACIFLQFIREYWMAVA